MSAVPFEKMHGLGNDFVIVRRASLPGRESAEQFVRWCDRREGIGADGVLVLFHESDRGFAMRVYNRDGSIPEICGNGIRCAVVSWAARRGLPEGEARVVTGAGPKTCRFDRWGMVTVDMGPARLADDDLPPAGPAGAPTIVPVRLGGRSVDAVAISMGNPHMVLFGVDREGVSTEEASALEHHGGFPNRVNVSFAEEPREGRIPLRVWERGVGFTRACGSAACATAVAAVASRRVAPDIPLTVALPGGELRIRVSGDLQSVEMTGPAVLVFRGELVEGS